MKKATEALKKYISPFAFVSICVFSVGLTVITVCKLSSDFADFWNGTVGAFFRALLSYITYLLPVSFAEYVLLCSPLIITVLTVYSAKKASKSWVSAWRCIISLLSCMGLIFGCLYINFAPGYHTTPLEERLGMECEQIGVKELSDTAKILLEQANAISENLQYADTGFSVMNMDTDELSRELNEAYGKVCSQYGFIQNMKSRVKPVMLSEPLTYTHIAGIYTFFTGEANLNMNFPDYTLPFSAAHEMAHQRGIAREEEANFVAFLVCINSDNDYIKYSGYVSVYEYVASALYSTDAEEYSSVISDMNRQLRSELVAYSTFFEKYRDSTASDVSGAVNDTYLKQNGQQAGSQSYELVVELAVAYFKGLE